MIPRRPDPLIGRVVAGRFPILDLIGRGAFGSVYRAEQRPIGREVALKVMATNSASQADLRARFFREAQVVARLSHPSTVTLFDYGQDQADGLLYMVLELIRGETLRDALLREAPLDPERVCRLTLQVLGALVEAHGLGLIHRDLKPANIMLTVETTGEERAKVLDFGMAKVLAGDDETSSEATRSGIVVGTPRYLSPEQAMARKVGPQTDVYALGVVMYEMLCGHPPFVAPSTFELLVMHTTAEVPRLPAELGVPPALEAVVRQAMAKAIDDRFPDAQAMLDALRRAMSAGGIPRHRSRPPRPRRDSARAIDVEAPTETLSADDLRAVARSAAALLPADAVAAPLRDRQTDPARPSALVSALAAPDVSSDVRGAVEPAASTTIAPAPRSSGSGGLWMLAMVILVAGGVAVWLFVDRARPGAIDPPGAVATTAPVAAEPAEPAAGELGAAADPAGGPAADIAAGAAGTPGAAVADEPAGDSDDAGAPDAAPRGLPPVTLEAIDLATPPPKKRELRAAIRRAERAIRAGRGGPAVDEAASLIGQLIISLDPGESRAEWHRKRGDLWMRLAKAQAGEGRMRSVAEAFGDARAAMTLGDRTRNFADYKRAVALAQELHGDLSDQALAFACSPDSLGEYRHRASYCSILEIRAGEARFEASPAEGAKLICKGADRYVVELPNQSEAQHARRAEEKQHYRILCAVRTRSAEDGPEGTPDDAPQ